MSVAWYRVCLDLSDRGKTPPIVVLRQYDCGGTLSFLITNNDRAMDLTGFQVRFMAKTPDGRLYYKDLGPSMALTIPTAITAKPGVLHPYIQIRGADSQLRTTGEFDILIQPAYDLSDEELGAYKTALDRLIDEFSQLKDEQKAEWIAACQQVDGLCDELRRRADDGEFDGPPGRAATVTVGSIRDGPIAVLNSGTDTDAVLDFSLPDVTGMRESEIDSIFI